MVSGIETEFRRTLLTPADQELVLQELRAVVSSAPFRNSKRYPALLKHIVEKTLAGETADLKERVLGSEVFERRPDYDTNADPVVRVSAGEIRKRIAQYYQESGADRAVQISVPLGSYVPEFRFRGAARALAEEAPAGTAVTPTEDDTCMLQSEPGSTVQDRDDASTALVQDFTLSVASRWKRAVAAVFLVLLVGSTWMIYRQKIANRGADDFWGAPLQSSGSALIVVGHGFSPPESAETPLIDHMLGPYDHISLSSAIALSAVSGALQVRHRTYEIKDDMSTSLRDLESRPVVLLGAMNDRWTQQLVRPLRFHFAQVPIEWIQDAENPSKIEWAIDNSKPYTKITTDYAILARYHDSTLNETVIIAAGLGPWANEAAGEFIASPLHLKELEDRLPDGWETRNIEVVLKTQVLGQEPGTTSIVAVHTWQ